MSARVSPKARWILLALVGLTLGVRSCHLANHLSGPLAHPETLAPSTDIAAFSAWAHQLADGDWLDARHYHPHMDWMEAYASPEEFAAWWGGAAVYHQAPLYPYLLAGSYALTGGSPLPLLLLQVLASTLCVLLVFDLGRRLLDERAGLFAAALAGLFAPSIVLDAVLLRASLNAFATLGALWLLFRLRDAPRPALAFVAGLALGLGFMLRESGLVLLLAGPTLLLAFASLRRAWPRWLPALALGAVVALAPFVARNLVVGAPALAFSTRGPETIIHSNARGVDPAFMSTPPADEFRRYMDAGNASLGAALAVSIDSWPYPSWRWWLWHQRQKTIALLGDYEVQNNVNFYTYRRASPWLRALPGFGVFAGLSLVGVVLLARFGRERRLGAIVLVAAGALALGSVLGYSLGRYRAPLAVLLTVPAGATLSLVLGWLRSGERSRAGAAALALGAAAAISLGSYTLVPLRAGFTSSGEAVVQERAERRVQHRAAALRALEFTLAADARFARGEGDVAVHELGHYLDEYEAFHRAEAERARALREASARAVARRLNYELREHFGRVAATLERHGEAERGRAVRARTDALLPLARRQP